MPQRVKNILRREKNLKTFLIAFSILVLAIGGATVLKVNGVNNARAVNDLIKGGNFEDNLEKFWVNWKASDNSRSYDFHRSYEVSSFGNGSYSAAVTVSGEPQDEIAGIISDGDNNNFSVEGGKSYYLRFYAKASEEMDIFSLLEDKNQDYAKISPWKFSSVTTEWQKYLVEVTPTSTTDSAVLMMGYNNMPEGATLYLDGVSLFEKNIEVNTDKVQGKIGQERRVNLSDLSFFGPEDVEIELPYYDGEQGERSTIKIEPKRVNGSNLFFDLKKGTFPGIGRVYVAGEMVGEFQYNVLPRIEEISPVLARGGSNLTVYGSGFIPNKDNTFLVIRVKDSNGNKQKKWLKYSFVDSDLSNATFEIPSNVVKGQCYIITSYTDPSGETEENKSNTFGYEVKPRINRVEWSKKGYEQVGDKIRIQGKGIAGYPRVHFYNSNGEHVKKKRASILSAGKEEVMIEVDTPNNINKLSVTVEAGGSMSNKKEALTYVAKPELKKILSPKKRKMNANSARIPAAKTGDKITFIGQGFNTASDSVVAEFQGLNERITVPVKPENINNRGNKIEISVPEKAQNGYTTIIVNGKESNYLPLEIIPSIKEVTPEEIEAGNDIVVKATGVGDNVKLTQVHFSLGNGETVVKPPHKIERENGQALVHVEAPANLSHSQSNINIQYDRWRSDEEFDLQVSPHISRASINMDNQVLTIKGHGFSLDPRENKITYKYANEEKTVVDPKTKKLGVYPTEEGQELRIKILDDYHYGHVSVQVGDKKSNEVNFGPVKIKRLARRIEFMESENKEMGVLYISGYNFGEDGGVRVGDHWADVHYRSEFFVIALVEEQYLYDNPVVIAKQ